MYLNITSFLSATVCNSNLTGHCNQKESNSSVYPIKKYIFLALTFRAIIPAIRMILCCLLIITSLTNSPCHVPVMNLRMNMSSTAVWGALSPPLTLARKFKSYFKEMTQLSRSTRIPGVPRLLVGYFMRRLSHFVC